jgi:hypothetical protein
LIEGYHLSGLSPAIVAITATVAFRIMAIIFNWRTRPVGPAPT